MLGKGVRFVQRYIPMINGLRYSADTPYRGVGYSDPYRGHRSLDLQNPSVRRKSGIFRTNAHFCTLSIFTLV